MTDAAPSHEIFTAKVDPNASEIFSQQPFGHFRSESEPEIDCRHDIRWLQNKNPQTRLLPSAEAWHDLFISEIALLFNPILPSLTLHSLSPLPLSLSLRHFQLVWLVIESQLFLSIVFKVTLYFLYIDSVNMISATVKSYL